MNAKLFVWNPDGWRTGIPPGPGLYLLRTYPSSEKFDFRALVTPISATDAVYQADETTPPLLVPLGAMWLCEHESIDEIHNLGACTVPQDAFCRSCGAHGRLVTREDLVKTINCEEQSSAGA